MMDKAYILVFFFFIGFVLSDVPQFTGYANQDFANLQGRDLASYFKFNDTKRVTIGNWLKSHNRTSGVDMDAVHMYYDDANDVMLVGIQCAGICGDTDGDGNPSDVDPLAPKGTLGDDNPNLCFTEQFSLMMWLNLPEGFTFKGKPPGYFFPTMVVGVDYPSCIWDEDTQSTDFYAYEWKDYRDCLWPTPLNDSNVCYNTTAPNVLAPGQDVYSGIRLDTMHDNDPANYPYYLPPPNLFTYFPNTTHPHIEFSLAEFSKYPQQNFVPGAPSNVMRMGFAGSSGSSADTNGEDAIYSTVWELKWDCHGFPNGNATWDECLVCGGDNTSCMDCKHVPNGASQYDACGVCDGDNSTCWDCFHVPHGTDIYDGCGVCGGHNKSIDACGVCFGDNSTCWDCKHIPNGPNKYDACGVCAGNNQSCWDCKHIPNGPNRYDACGVCAGNNQTCWDCKHIPNGLNRYDACGVCAGDNSTCWDCKHIPRGPNRYDACGVCAGNNQSCWDCKHIPNGPNRYDSCGVCAGNNRTCWDCKHIPNGLSRYDACGVCDGDNSTCWDCKHIPNGPNRYDSCGVCAGDNTTCQDCFDIPNGPNRYDDCGVCAGDNSTCQDCKHVPNGLSKYDACGVCDGDNSTCWDCAHVPHGSLKNDTCGVCGGDNSTCVCYKYLGYEEPYLCFALLRWSIAASRTKIQDTLTVLYTIKNELPYYDYTSNYMALHSESLDGYIDTLHNFCDECLDSFDYAQVWFAERLAGNCEDCDQLEESDFTWQL